MIGWMYLLAAVYLVLSVERAAYALDCELRRGERRRQLDKRIAELEADLGIEGDPLEVRP